MRPLRGRFKNQPGDKMKTGERTGGELEDKKVNK